MTTSPIFGITLFKEPSMNEADFKNSRYLEQNIKRDLNLHETGNKVRF